MKIKDLKKFTKIKSKRKLTNHEKNLLITELLHTEVTKVLIIISKLLDLYLAPSDVKSSDFVVDIKMGIMYLVEKYNIDTDILSYYRSYTMFTRVWEARSSLSSNEILSTRTDPAYSYDYGYAHGGNCTTSKVFRKALAIEILKLPSEPVTNPF